tara:strand:+ start:1101 stop:1592 length:492 start_codon:yes stop_codon:yes gene_type:complete
MPKKSKVNEKVNEKKSGNVFSNMMSTINNSKFFAGIVMLMINIGSKYITIELSKTQEAYLKYTLARQLLIFSLIWMGTRDIVISLVLTAVFIVLANYLFNENSKFCILPKKFREFKDLLDTNNDGKISEKEIKNAIDLLSKAKKNKQHKNKVEMLSLMKEKYI